jgi:phosphate-selective porin
MRHRRRDLGDTPWVTIAAIVGVIAVVIIALVFFLGGGSGQTSGASSPGSSSSGSSSVAPQTTLLTNKGVASITVKVTTPVSVPATGAWIEVNYLGSFSGSYGTNASMQTTQNSGDKLFGLEDSNGTISAKFQKLDSSTKHDLTVQIWKDGKAVKFAKNSSAFGIVSIQYS